MMSKVGLIVDGVGDHASMKARFKNGYIVLKTDGPRGHEARPEKIAAASRKQIAILRGFKCSKVVVLIDVEARTITYDQFISKLRTEFNKIDFGLPVVACAANLMIENWYLADILNLSKNKAYLRNQKTQKRYDGKNGKNEIKKLLVANTKYSETKHGPDMFKSMSFETARNYSPSFSDFLDSI